MSGDNQSPGELIRAELEKRSWTQADLASILGKHLPAVSEIIQGKRSITPEMSLALAAAFGTSAEYWINLDSSYRVSLLEPNTDVERRAKVFQFAPIRDMEKRGWIKQTDSLDRLEHELCAFFNVPSLDAEPKIHANARLPLNRTALDTAQVAWCIRAAKLAACLDVASFKDGEFKRALPELKKLTDYPEKVKQIPRLLSEVGVRFVVVEPLPHSPIDGAAFWLADDAPVIVLSVRFDRIDCFWHTLAHECSHISNRDSQSIDSDLVGESTARDLEEIEMRANREGAELLIPQDKLKSFIIRVKPFYSKERIIQFAHRMRVHPGIVAGQLQFRREIGWHANREMLVKVRDHVSSTAFTDGWGQTISAKL